MEEYYKFLIDIYDKDIVNTFTAKKGNSLEFNDDQIELNKFMIIYNKSDSVCRCCQKIFSDYENRSKKQDSKIHLNFEQRPMEFPNWLGSLNFKEVHAKEIMIIGQAAGPDIQTNINVSYGLANLHSCIELNGIMDTNKINLLFESVEKQLKNHPDFPKLREKIQKTRKAVRNNLWERFYDIFGEYLHDVMNMIYLTDLSRCNYKSNYIWREFVPNCKEYLFQEIEFINPKVIIFLGTDAYEGVKKSAKFIVDEDKETAKIYRITSNFPRIGTITSQEGNMHIKFVKIYHNKPYRTKKYWNQNINTWKSIFRDEIFPLFGLE